MVDGPGCARERGHTYRKRPERHVPVTAGLAETLDLIVARVAGAPPRAVAEGFDRGDDALGNQSGGVRGVPALESGRHRSAQGGIGNETLDEARELFGCGDALFQKERGAGFDEALRVVELVVVRGGRKGDQDRRYTHGGKLGERRPAAAADG